MIWIEHDTDLGNILKWTASLGILGAKVFPSEWGYRYRIGGEKGSVSILFLTPEKAMVGCEVSLRHWMNECLKILRSW